MAKLCEKEILKDFLLSLNEKDVDELIKNQEKTLNEFHKTNTILEEAISLSNMQIGRMMADIESHSSTLNRMRRDMENLHKSASKNIPKATQLSTSTTYNVLSNEGPSRNDSSTKKLKGLIHSISTTATDIIGGNNEPSKKSISSITENEHE
ncbi:hypothetical protein SNEBB_001992 [Seison nebaliae]|nr:hypothetical protein SNEBB_001992 [Seison nebaliae]